MHRLGYGGSQNRLARKWITVHTATERPLQHELRLDLKLQIRADAIGAKVVAGVDPVAIL